jgi:4-amino-4-deoxy-L-arabinose transferase-like glycosyltransferase
MPVGSNLEDCGVEMRSHRRYWLQWTVLLLLAAALRFPAPDWDGGIAAHPDERFLLDVAQKAPLWGDPCAAAPDFPYGHLPLYVARALVMVAPHADPLYAARLFSGLLGILLVVLAGAFGRALAGDRAGLLAAAVMAFAPFPIQQARFFTVDPLGAVFASGAVLAGMRRRWRTAGAFAGLAVACKVSLGWVFVPLVVGGLSQESRVESRRAGAARRAASTLLSAVAAFALASPWALLRPAACWRGPLIQAAMAAGRFDFPYTRQYAGTAPFVYPLVQMALWGLGPAAALAGVAGVGLAVRRRRRLSFAKRVALIWTVVYFLATAGLYVKFPRYLLPIYPVWAAWAIWAVGRPGESVVGRLKGALAVCLFTLPLGLAQVAIYAEPHPWIEASRWIYAGSPPGATIAVEQWDHPLPVLLPEGAPERYTQVVLPVFGADLPEKQAQLEDALEGADVIVLASRRGYGALSRQPERYAATLTWYRALLTERAVVAFGRCPRLGPLALADDPLADAGLPAPASLAKRCRTPYALRLPRLDESFRVYDAPMALVMKDDP